MPVDTGLVARRVDVTLLADFESAALGHPEARGLFRMWTELRAGRPAPFRAELDAGRIGARAPFLAILEYVGPSNFRIRIAGDRLNRWFGMELRGMSALSLVEAGARGHLQSVLNRVAAEPAVAAVTGEARSSAGGGGAGGFEMTLLPMRSDFGRIDRVLVGLWLSAPGLATPPVRLEAMDFTVAAIVDEPAEDEPQAPPPPPDGDGPGDRPNGGGPRRGHLRLVKG